MIIFSALEAEYEVAAQTPLLSATSLFLKGRNMWEGDILMFATGDGGEIEMKNGQPQMCSGLQTAVFLSLFGGNYGDDGRQGNKKTWWGNLDEAEASYKYISRFQNLRNQSALTPANLIKFEQAVLADLAWLEEEKIAGSIEVETSIPARNFLALNIKINQPTDFSEKFFINWETAAIEICS